ncbi:putative lipid-binding protein AIR1, partial [Mucuna pruriens]
MEMGSKKCILMALNLAVMFSLVIGCDKCPSPIPSPKTASSLGTFCKRVELLDGFAPKKHCCAAIEGLVDYQVAICLCTALKANIFSFNLTFPSLISTSSTLVPRVFKETKGVISKMDKN